MTDLYKNTGNLTDDFEFEEEEILDSKFAVFKGKKQITCEMPYHECEGYLMGEAFPEKLQIKKLNQT